MHDVTSYLKELCECESAAKRAKDASPEERQKQILKLRQLIPEQILGHYDRFVKAGKVPVIGVRHGVCMGCFVSLSTGALQKLIRQDDLNLCEHCGRYIYPIAEVAPPVAPVEEPKPPRARRGRAARPVNA